MRLRSMAACYAGLPAMHAVNDGSLLWSEAASGLYFPVSMILCGVTMTM